MGKGQGEEFIFFILKGRHPKVCMSPPCYPPVYPLNSGQRAGGRNSPLLMDDVDLIIVTKAKVSVL